MDDSVFDYATAFSRTIGWITPEEQVKIRNARVAIAGLGGVGGNHLITLTRLGIGRFNLAEFDEFGVENFNRQYGASCSTVGRSKLDVMVEKCLDINSEADLSTFNVGVQPENVDEFLKGADVYVDGLDFFALEARKLVFKRCHELKIPVVTVAPLGTGAALLNFSPEGMDCEEYFGFEGHSETDQYLRFLLGLSPAMLQMKYLVYPEAIDLPNRKGPSTPMACEICAGVAGTEVLKLLTGRGEVLSAPYGLHFDPFRNTYKKTCLKKGMNGLFQRLKLTIAKRRLEL